MSKQRKDTPLEGYRRDIEVHYDANGDPVSYTVGDLYKIADDERDTPPGVAVIVEDDE